MKTTESTLMVEIRFFAKARELAGTERLHFTLPTKNTLVDLKHLLCVRVPSLEAMMPHLLFSVENNYVSEEFVFSVDSEVACFPPVSGG